MFFQLHRLYSVPLDCYIILSGKWVDGLEGGDHDYSSRNSPEIDTGSFAEMPTKLPGFERVSYRYKLNVILHQPAPSECRVGGD